jgi:outer membrane protein OmpA-like peptidoglycan-associated protein
MRLTQSVTWVLAGLVLTAVPVALSGQSTAKQNGSNSFADSPSRWDFFAGYSYLSPHGTDSQGIAPTAINFGSIYSFSYYFNKYVGAQLEADEHIPDESAAPCSNCGKTWGNADFSGGGPGLIFRYPGDLLTPFVHGLVEVQNVGIDPGTTNDVWGIGVEGGGGLDLETPLWNHRLAIRLIQADYQYAHANWPAGRGNFDSAQLSAGFVIHGGSFTPPPQLAVACAVNPTSVFPGDPVTATSTVSNQAAKENVISTISGDGISGSQTGTTATVNTGNLSPGTHTVKCDAKEGKSGKEGVKPYENAQESTATFTVREFEPPTISCSANPSTLKPGDTATITATGTSPQNRPLTYTYSAASGSVNGSGTTATYNSTGAPTGSVDITCNVTDDKNHSASSTAMVTIEAPPPPQPTAPPPEQVRLEARLALHSVFFPTAQPTVKDPTGGLVASQEKTLATLAADYKEYLQYKPDAHLILTGHADVRGSVEFNQALSERRVARAKQYLVEQGIPESSIETRAVGKERELTADEVKELIDQNPDLSETERAQVLRRLNVIVLAQNRRVDITLSTTGQQSVRQFPFNAKDSLTLLDEKASAPRRKTKAKPKP